MKGIILAGGAGTRLYPLTKVVTKQLQPLYDKPMIYYPLSILMLGKIKDILIITTPHDLPMFQTLLGDGQSLGISIEYATQSEPKGIAEAFLIGENFIGKDDVTLILGDNLFHGSLKFFEKALEEQTNKVNNLKARVFAYLVSDPERYGVVEFDKKSKTVLSIEEKPSQPKSKYAIPGLYLYDNSVIQRAKNLSPGHRGELEITDLNITYLKDGELGVEMIGRGVAWLDTGTPKSLLEASHYIAAIEQRQGRKVSCLEEIALRRGFIDRNQFEAILDQTPKGPYKDYLHTILREIEEEI